MNQPQLNPDALRRAADAVSELYADGHCPKAEDAAEVAVSAYLAAALPEEKQPIHLEKLAIARENAVLALDDLWTPEQEYGSHEQMVDAVLGAWLEVFPLQPAALPEVTSVEELKALPIGSVILDGGGDVGIIEPGAILFAETNPLSPEYVAKHYLPARVLYRPVVKP